MKKLKILFAAINIYIIDFHTNMKFYMCRRSHSPVKYRVYVGKTYDNYHGYERPSRSAIRK